MAEGWDDWDDDFGTTDNNQPMPTSTTSNDDYAWVDDNTQASSSFNGGDNQFSDWQEDSSQDTNWGTPQGTQQTLQGFETNSSMDDFGDFGGAEIENNNTKKFNLGLKQAGVIIAGGFILLALILYVISNINVSKKPTNTNSTQTNQQQQQNTNQNNSSQTSNQNNANEEASTPKTNKSDVALITVPKSTSVDYSGKIYEATGSVVNKTKYLCDNQLVYLIQVEIPFGSDTMTVNYFCGYNVYNNVATGDVVTVNYQQVSDTCFSVNTLVK